MKTDGAIKHKIQQVIFRHRKKFVESGLKKRPCNCVHNGIVKLPKDTSNRTVVRICLYGIGKREEWNNLTCDETLGGIQQAQQCPMFQRKSTPKQLKDVFGSMLGLDGTPVEIGWIAREYPDIAALMWVMGPNEKESNGVKAERPPEQNILMFFSEDEMLEDEVSDELLEEKSG